MKLQYVMSSIRNHLGLNAEPQPVDSRLADGAGELMVCVREALRQSLLREQESQWIAREAAIGFTQLEAGQTVEIQSEQHFIDLVRGDA